MTFEHRHENISCSEHTNIQDIPGSQPCLTFRNLAKSSKKSKIKINNVDPWDMLNNFCFHVYAQKSLFIVENDIAVSGD